MKFSQRKAITQGATTALLVIGLLMVAFYAITQPIVAARSSSTTSLTTISTSTVQSSTTATTCSGACGTYGSATGVIIPLYQGVNSPNLVSFVSQLITLRGQFPTVPMIAIINPDSGVGTYSATMATEAQLLENAGIYVFGYDWTGYCQTNVPYVAGGNPYLTLTDIEQNMSDYKAWYNVSGIFFDGMSSKTGCEGFYTGISTYAHNIAITYTMGNPGTTIPQSYLNTVNSMVVYEGDYLPTISTFQSNWYATQSKYNFGLIAFNQPQLSPSYIQTAAQYVGWMFITDNTGCPPGVNYIQNVGCNDSTPLVVNPYNTLPSYLAGELSALASVATPG